MENIYTSSTDVGEESPGAKVQKSVIMPEGQRMFQIQRTIKKSGARE